MSAWILLRRFMLSSCMLLGVGCSALINVDGKQCVMDSDCMQKGLAGQCEDNVCVPSEVQEADVNASCTSDANCSGVTPRCLLTTHACVSSSIGEQFACLLPPPAETETVHYQFNVRLSVELTKAPENLVVKACEPGDVICRAPLDVFMDTAGDGLVQFELPKGKPVFFEVTSSGITVLSYTSNISELDNPKVRDVFVPTMAVSDSFSDTGLTASVDPDKGTAIIQLEDCGEQPASGVHFKLNPESGDDFYLQHSLPSFNATVTSYDEAIDIAYGGFGDVNPGIVEISAYWGVDGPLLNSITTQVRPNTITMVEMHTRTR